MAQRLFEIIKNLITEWQGRKEKLAIIKEVLELQHLQLAETANQYNPEVQERMKRCDNLLNKL